MPEHRTWVEVKPYSEFKTEDVVKMNYFQEALQEDHRRSKTDSGQTAKGFLIFVGSPYFNGRRHSYKVYGETIDIIVKPALEKELEDYQMRWTQCPFCEEVDINLYYKLVDVDGNVIEEQMTCQYCRKREPSEVLMKVQGPYRTWSGSGYTRRGAEVSTTRIGYILGSPRLMKGYKAARSFKAPRKKH